MENTVTILFENNKQREKSTKFSNLRVAGRARGAEGVVAAADLNGYSGGQVDFGAVQLVGVCLL